ncbi:MAG: response regulator [Candidatus Omnitrophica bacterium]|nr:response regulator [Candidatus Omnitrophota bacterium]
MKKILIVDDEPRITEAFIDAFGLDYVVASANDGRRALELLESFKPDLVVLDWRLGGDIQGRDVLITIKENHPHLPVFVVTASFQFMDEIKSLGANSCLLKPCTDLRERILEVLPTGR